MADLLTHRDRGNITGEYGVGVCGARGKGYFGTSNWKEVNCGKCKEAFQGDGK